MRPEKAGWLPPSDHEVGRKPECGGEPTPQLIRRQKVWCGEPPRKPRKEYCAAKESET